MTTTLKLVLVPDNNGGFLRQARSSTNSYWARSFGKPLPASKLPLLFGVPAGDLVPSQVRGAVGVSFVAAGYFMLYLTRGGVSPIFHPSLLVVRTVGE